MAIENEATPSAADAVQRDVIPAQMTRNAAEAAMQKLVSVEPTESDRPSDPVDDVKTLNLDEDKQHPAEPVEPAEPVSTETKAEDEGKLPDEAKAILQKRINEISGKSKAEVEKAKAAAETAQAEAATLRAQAEASRSDHILKAGLLPELLNAEQAKLLENYADTQARLNNAKWVLRNARDKVEGGDADTEFDGTGFNGKPYKATARQWRDAAEDERDRLDLIVRELAPLASSIKRDTAARQSEIYKIGLDTLRKRESATKKVAEVGAERATAPAVKVAVKAAAGVKVPSAQAKRGVTAEEFKTAARRDGREAASSYFATMTG